MGCWGSDVNGKSSNYRELKNLVDSMISLTRQENLEGTEIFLFTDNTNFRAFWYVVST